MSTLKVNKLRDTAGSADAITLDPNGGAVLAGVTTVSTVKVGSGVTISSDGDVFTTGITTSSTVIVGSGVTISESGIEASGIGITCANINGGQISGRRNIIINGAMQVAQRGTSSTASSGYNTVDRIKQSHGGADEAPTYAQVDVASGTTPYTLGFRKAFKVTNGNQTSGAGAGDYIQIDYFPEAQDIANSGWNYTSTSSYVTVSFWIKSSVAQAFPFTFRTQDGTSQAYNTSTGSLTADTWTKITKTIPGNSNLQFDNDNDKGARLMFFPYIGTTYTTNGLTLDTWSAWADAKHSFEMATTWWTTNDATWEITGFQLEVGSQATAFEHRSFGEELSLCQRYFCKSYDIGTAPATATFVGAIHGRNYDGTGRSANPVFVYFVSRMRAQPTMTFYAGDGQSNKFSTGSTVGGTDLTTESTFGTSFINSESGIFHCDLAASVPALNLFAFQYTADAEL